jgi:hypothetical protein
MSTLALQAAAGGQINLNGTNTASTFDLTVPAINSTLATLTGVETLTNKTLVSPTLSAVALGTPASGTLTNCTSLPVGGITATGTPSSTTFLRGDSTWATIATNAISNGTSNVTVNSSGGTITATTAGTTAVTIDTSQNVGIGTTSPSGRLDVTTGSNNYCYFQSTADSDAGIRLKNSGRDYGIFANGGSGSANALRFYDFTAGAERMRIDSSGNLLVGRTTKQTDIAGTPTNVQSSLGYSCYDGTQSAQFNPTRIYFNGANGFYVLNASDTGVRLVNGATSWSAQSDERTKTDLVPIANGLEKVNTLRAVTGRYTKDEEGVSRAFLIAQDVKAVLPEAVDEETDEEKTLGLRYTDVIPLLVASIKELKAINDTQAETINAQSAALAALTARVVALEAK